MAAGLAALAEDKIEAMRADQKRTAGENERDLKPPLVSGHAGTDDEHQPYREKREAIGTAMLTVARQEATQTQHKRTNDDGPFDARVEQPFKAGSGHGSEQ